MQDTEQTFQKLHIKLLRRLTAEDKLLRLGEFWECGRELTFSALRAEFPGASEQEIHNHFATRTLGRDFARRYLGWDPEQ